MFGCFCPLRYLNGDILMKTLSSYNVPIKFKMEESDDIEQPLIGWLYEHNIVILPRLNSINDCILYMVY